MRVISIGFYTFHSSPEAVIYGRLAATFREMERLGIDRVGVVINEPILYKDPRVVVSMDDLTEERWKKEHA